MDHQRFDAMTRSVASGTLTRRAALRLSAGIGLGLLAARLALAGDVEAAQKKRRHRSEARHNRALQAEGKGKGKKGKGKGKKKPPQPPVPDPPCPDGKGLCPDDVTCVYFDECCPGEQHCPDDSCISVLECCEGQKRCGEFDCIANDECCGEDPVPLCGECQEVVCDNGQWVCRTNCECAGYVCRPGMEPDPDTCICLCPADGQDHGWFCCPSSHPQGYSQGGFKTWCLNADQEAICPLGWTPYRDSGLCYPGNPPS